MRAHPASALPLLPGALALLAALAVTAPGYAQNLIPTNPEFDGFDDTIDKFPGWTTTSVVPVEGDDADGCPNSGSFRGESDGSFVFLFADDCVAVNQGDLIHLEVTYRSEVGIHLRLAQFTAGNCTGPVITVVGPAPIGPSAEWATARVAALIDNSSYGSVKYWLIAQEDASPFVAEFDRAYLGRVERIFADDFDGGGVCRWSDVVDGLPL